jgi:adenosylcobinamide-GDP ribazoletransferase
MIPWDALRAAVAFLTRFPVGSRQIEPAAEFWAPAYYPLVGAGLGALSYGAFCAAQPLGINAAAVLTTAIAVLVTGAFHEDGLADSADGLLGAVSRKRALEIMKDSRIGTYGAAALVLVLLMRVSLLVRIGSGGWVALVLSTSLARLGPVWILTHLNHAAPDHSKQMEVLGVGRARAVWASVSMLGVCGALLCVKPAQAISMGVAWCAACAVTVYVWRLGKRRLGGITGDLLGACEQLGEVAILGVFAVGV